MREKYVPHPLDMPLCSVPVGRTVVISTIRAGQTLSARLAAMGLLPGVPFRVCRNGFGGPVMVAVKGTRLMLGQGMAQRLWVREAAV